jgi:aspartate aminotransferase-like enzyme
VNKSSVGLIDLRLIRRFSGRATSNVIFDRGDQKSAVSPVTFDAASVRNRLNTHRYLEDDMSALYPDIDPDGLLEYSVVFTDRSLNHMSQSFQGVMTDVSTTLKTVYNAHSVVIVPGGGTYGMEAVARQFGNDKKCMVIRNGWFSFRWSQIFDAGGIPSKEIVLKAKPIEEGSQAAFAPVPLDEIVAQIVVEKPDVVFAPHVETSSGMILPDDYMRGVADAVHAVGGLFVLDCVASGTIWVDMEQAGIDVLISAPQKGWSASPCSALVMMSELARTRIDDTASSSFSADLKKWMQIMEAYEGGGHAYHATMPTDAIVKFHESMKETEEYGFDKVRDEQQELGDKVRALMAAHGFKSLAAPGFEAPGVVVCYTDDPDIHNGSKFAAAGLQTAAGVPLMCDEPDDFRTFRVGLFGLDKLHNVDRTVASLEKALVQVTGGTNVR